MKRLIFGLALFISGFFATIALIIAYFVVIETTKSGAYALIIEYLKTGHFIPLLIITTTFVSLIGLVVCVVECFIREK